MNREMASANAGAPGEPKGAGEGKKVLLFLPEAFEDLEAVAALSMCGWTGYRAHLPNVSVDCTGFHEVAHGRFGLSVPIDVPIGEVDPLSYDALVVPGDFMALASMRPIARNCALWCGRCTATALSWQPCAWVSFPLQKAVSLRAEKQPRIRSAAGMTTLEGSKSWASTP